MAKNNNHKAVSYNKWGYIFLIPFVVVYLIFQLVPLISTIYNSFFENYRSGNRILWDLPIMQNSFRVVISGSILKTQ